MKVRFAPSPTGYLHIGGARTCLFNWLYARHSGGKFLLRIEDTDLVRSKKEYLDEILASIKWLGMDWDELVFQSQRFELYREYAQKLVAQSKAFRQEGAVFFKYEFSEIVIEDLIRGRIEFRQLPKDTEVIIKSDGSPGYNFACVIDDALLGITDVIRGEDHISNTPKQILLYQALEFTVPRFAHLPLILSESGGRMSKRFGATAVSEYKKAGYLPQALANYLLLLGWSPGKNQEIIPLPQAKEKFELRQVNKTSAAFSLDKLNWVNSQYIKAMPIGDLTDKAAEFLKERNIDFKDRSYLQKVVALFQGRISTLGDLAQWGDFCFRDDFSYAEDTKEVLSRDLSGEVNDLIENLSEMEQFNHTNIEHIFRETASALELKARDLVHPVRVALTGKRIGPGLFETMEVLGKEKVISRLNRLVDYWRKTKEGV